MVCDPFWAEQRPWALGMHLGRAAETQNVRQRFLTLNGVVSMLKAVSSVALPVVIVVLVALAVTGNLFGVSPILIGIQLTSVGLAAWARRSFPRGSFRVVATPGGETLVRKGPYRLIRHPMYSAALLLVWSGVLPHVSSWTVTVGLLATCVVVVRIVVEERLLRERYEDYGRYAQATKALIPFVA